MISLISLFPLIHAITQAINRPITRAHTHTRTSHSLSLACAVPNPTLTRLPSRLHGNDATAEGQGLKANLALHRTLTAALVSGRYAEHLGKGTQCN